MQGVTTTILDTSTSDADGAEASTIVVAPDRHQPDTPASPAPSSPRSDSSPPVPTQTVLAPIPALQNMAVSHKAVNNDSHSMADPQMTTMPNNSGIGPDCALDPQSSSGKDPPQLNTMDFCGPQDLMSALTPPFSSQAAPQQNSITDPPLNSLDAMLSNGEFNPRDFLPSLDGTSDGSQFDLDHSWWLPLDSHGGPTSPIIDRLPNQD